MINPVSPPQVLLLTSATGDSGPAARGRLLENLAAMLLEKFGYEQPTSENLRTTSRGIELDVRATHSLNGSRVIVECKAYSSNVSASELSTFYGKLAAERLDDPGLYGWLVALPGLTSPGVEKAEHIRQGDDSFRLTTASDFPSLLSERGLISWPPREADRMLADPAIVVTEHGIFTAAKELDTATRLPVAVFVWSSSTQVPDPVLDLVRAADYSAEISLVASGHTMDVSTESAADPPVVVEVIGSASDFEYQLPASPKYFVGRRATVKEFRGLLDAGIGNGRIVVVNAKSGWGKSSLALRIKQLVDSAGGYGTVFDSRTAVTQTFIWATIREAALEAESRGILALPQNAAFSSLQTAIGTLRDSTWRSPRRPLLVFYDQFETVFRDADLTRAFRDLAFLSTDSPIPLILGFAWKTDLVGWTENHPYQYRDDIRQRSTILSVEPFGPTEINTLLSRLERELGVKLERDLRRRLREFSQGLPWLFKKLASHLMHEMNNGVSQDELVAEALNARSLFESDLAGLDPHENEALRTIARMAPIPISEAVEFVQAPIVQSLLDRRLLVHVGERIDTYWDIFRDFLTTGRVPIQETYILRQTPRSVGKLLAYLVKVGEELTPAEAAEGLNMSEGTIFNLARDLRELGVLVARPGVIRLDDSLTRENDVEGAIRDRIATALRRHRAYSIVTDALDSRSGPLSVDDFAVLLPTAYPAVEAANATWLTYARAFTQWFAYSELMSITRSGLKLGPREGDGAGYLLLDTPAGRTRAARPFPQGPAGPAIEIVQAVAGIRTLPDRSETALRKAISDLTILGFAQVDGGVTVIDTTSLADDGTFLTEILRERLETEVPGGRNALDLLIDDPWASAYEVGKVLGAVYRATWADSTVQVVGKHFRSWARAAGIVTERGRRPTAETATLPLALDGSD